MSCKFTFNGKRYSSLEELIKDNNFKSDAITWLLNSDFSSMQDDNRYALIDRIADKMAIDDHESRMKQFNITEADIEAGRKKYQQEEPESISDEIRHALNFAKVLSNSLGIEHEEVTEEEAQKITKNSDNPYDGQSAFFFGNKVYFVKGKFNTSSVFHEFSHPFVRSMMKTSPKQIDELLDDIRNSDEYNSIYEIVKKGYPNLDENDPLFKEEMIVVALSKRYETRTTKSEGLKEFARKFLFFVRQTLRKIFGKNIDAYKINLETKLDDIIDIINSGTGPKIDISTLDVFNSVAYQVIRDTYIEKQKKFQESVGALSLSSTVKDMSQETSVSTAEAINSIAEATKKLSNLVTELADNPDLYGDNEIFKAVFKDKDGDIIANMVKRMSKIENDRLRIAKVNEDTDFLKVDESGNRPSENEYSLFAKAYENVISNFTYDILTIEGQIKQIGWFFENLKNQDKAYLTKMIPVYANFVTTWKEYFGQLLHELEPFGLSYGDVVEGSYRNPLWEAINSITGQLENCDTFISDMYMLVAHTALKDSLAPIAEANRMEFEKQIADAKGNENLIKAYEEAYYGVSKVLFDRFTVLSNKRKSKRLTPNEENERNDIIKKMQNGSLIIDDNIIDLFLTGFEKDNNWFSKYLEGYMQSGNKLVAGVAYSIKKAQEIASGKMQQSQNDFIEEISPLLKELNYNALDVENFGKLLVFRDKVFAYEIDDNGKIQPNGSTKEVLTILNKWRDYRHDLGMKAEQVQKLREEWESSDDLNKQISYEKAKRDYEKWHHNYFYDKYISSYYLAMDELKSTDIGLEASIELARKQSEIGSIVSKAQVTSLSEEELKELIKLRREMQRLGSIYDFNGQQKTGIEYQKAILIKEYFDSMKKFYESTLNEGLFQRIYNDRLSAAQLKWDSFSEEEKKNFLSKKQFIYEEMKPWIDENTKFDTNEMFDEDKEIIQTKIDKIFAKYDIEVDKETKENLKQQKKGFRDNDGEYDVDSMDENIVKEIKKLEEKKVSQFKKLKNKLSEGNLSVEESLEIESDIEELTQLYKDLDTIRTYTPTQRYTERLNDFFNRLISNNNEQIKEYCEQIFHASNGNFVNSVDDLYNAIIVLLSKPELSTNYELLNIKKWVERNHISKPDFNTGGELTWQRLSIWSKEIPNEEGAESLGVDYVKTYTFVDKDGEQVTLRRVPTKDYYISSVKEEFITPRIEWQTIDNKGQYLPKPPEEVVEGDKMKYSNREYFELEKTNPTLFKLINIIGKHHLQHQGQITSKHSRLGYDLPRYEKEGLEDRLDTVRKMGGGLKDKFARKIRQYFLGGQGTGQDDGNNFDKTSKIAYVDMIVNPDTSPTIKTSVREERRSSVPIYGLADIHIDDVSYDVLTSVMRHMASSVAYQEMNKIYNPISMIQQVLNTAEGAVKDLSSFGRNRKGEYTPSKTQNTRDSINNLIEREFYGISNKGPGDKNVWIWNMTNSAMAISAFRFFANNPVSSIKNWSGMILQGAIEASAGLYYDHSDYAWGHKFSSHWASMEHLKYRYSKDVLPYEAQFVEAFDINQSQFNKDFAKRLGRSVGDDIAQGNFFTAFRQFSTDEGTIAVGASVLHHHKLMQKNSDGSKKEIRLTEAYEIRDGKFSLKSGIDARYAPLPTQLEIVEGDTIDSLADRYNTNISVINEALAKANYNLAKREGLSIPVINNTFFTAQRNLAHQVVNYNGGSYATFDRSELSRNWFGKIIEFLRKYAPSMTIRRFGGVYSWRDNTSLIRPRFNINTPGGQLGSMSFMINPIIRILKRNGAVMTAREKAGLLFCMAECLLLGSMLLMMRHVFDWDPDDDDKYKKLYKKSGWLPILGTQEDGPDFNMQGWLSNFALLCTMQVYSENAKMAPFFKQQRGLMEIVGDMSVMNQPILGSISSIFSDLIMMMYGNDKAYYTRKIGPYTWQEKGDYKLWTHISRMLSISGKFVDPVESIKSTYNMEFGGARY